MIDDTVGSILDNRYFMLIEVMEEFLEPLSRQMETATMRQAVQQMDAEMPNLIHLMDTTLVMYPTPHIQLNKIYEYLSKYLSYRGYYQQKIAWGKAILGLVVNAGETIYVSLLHRIANAYHDSGQYEDALRLGYFIVQTFQDDPEHPGLGLAYAMIAKTYGRIGRPNESLHFYQLAAAIEKKNNAPDRLAPILIEIADIYQENGYLEEGYTYAKQAYALARTLDNPYLLAEMTSDLARHMCGHRDPSEIKPMFEQAIQLMLAIDNQQSLAKTYFNYALYFRWIHEYSTALEFARKSLQIYEAYGSVWTAHVRQRLSEWEAAIMI